MANKSMVIESYIQNVDVSDSDSSSWEVIDPSDDDNFSYDGFTDDDDVVVHDVDDVDDVDGDVNVDDVDQESKDVGSFGSPSSDISMQSLLDQIDHHRQLFNDVVVKDEINDQDCAGGDSRDYKLDNEDVCDYEEFNDGVVKHEINGEDCADGDNRDYELDNEDVYDHEEEEDELDLDVDDELVPHWVNDKFERQRMRKLGKRSYPKMLKSKRLPCSYNRPGCVRGKHGLGLKHNLL